MSDKIYLETDEEITSAIDKIASAKSSPVYVLVPRRASIIQSIVNLKLLKRQADNLQKKIVLVTTDGGGRALAKKAGLATKMRLSGSDKKDNVEAPKVQEPDFSEPEEEIIEPDPNANETDLSRDIEMEEIPGLKRRVKRVSKDDSQKKKQQLSPWKKILAATKKEKTAKKQPGRRKAAQGKSGRVFLLPSLSIKSFTLFFATSIIVFGVVFFLVLPKADVMVVPKTEPFSTSFDMVVSRNISSVDVEKSTIPGELLSAEGKSEKKKFSSTGEKETGDKAHGQVAIYNNYSSESEYLPASTQIAYGDLAFVLLQDVTVPGAKVEGGDAVPGKVNVLVEAAEAGEDYNIGVTRFVITSLASSKQGDIYARSVTEFTGGSSNKMRVVSEDDLNKARDELLNNASQEVAKKLKEDVGEKKILRDEFLQKEILEVESSAEADAEADEFEMQVKAKISSFVFSEGDLAEYLSAKFSHLLSDEKYVIDPTSSEGLSYEKIEQEFGEDEALMVKLKVSKVVAWNLNEQKIKREIKDLDKEKALEYLKDNPNIISADISLWPFWVKKVPKTERKIEIQLDKDKIVDNI